MDRKFAGSLVLAIALVPHPSPATEALGFPTVTHTAALLSLCRDAKVERTCAELIETHQLARSANGVTRVGPELRLPLATGGVRALKDSNPDASPSENVRYLFIEFITELRSYACFAQYWEGSGLVLVPETGDSLIPLDAAPLFGPGRSHFATVSAAVAYNPNRIQIYGITKSRAVLEWSHEPKLWGPGAARWENISLLIVKTDGLANETQSPPGLPTEIRVRRSGGVWKAGSPLP